jgi:hypothetical protein
VIFLERRTVSRKTPGDGKLEITRPAARQLAQSGPAFTIDVAGRTGLATLGDFECTCRGPEERHVHYFLESELLKGLEPNTRIDVDFDATQRRLVVRACGGDEPISSESSHEKT